MKTKNVKKIAVIGKMGSGKSHICNIMEKEYNIPVFYTDNEARMLINNNEEVKKRLKHYFGNSIYNSVERIIPHRFADILFNDKKNLDINNSIIAPRIICRFYEWMNVIHEPPETVVKHVVFECSNLLDTDFYKLFDHIILITAPTEIRKRRVVQKRDIAPEDFDARDKMQMDFAEMEKVIAGKIPHTVFCNDGFDDINKMIKSTIFNEYGT